MADLTQGAGRLELDPRNALRALALVHDGDRLFDTDHDCTDLYDAGVVKSVRDYSDEYRAEFTRDGENAVKSLLSTLAPDAPLLSESEDR